MKGGGRGGKRWVVGSDSSVQIPAGVVTSPCYFSSLSVPTSKRVYGGQWSPNQKERFDHGSQSLILVQFSGKIGERGLGGGERGR